ncbi:tryptophan-rich sensory protein [Clostridium sp. SHJSY1]|uniref:TspO/MBR family protein n=1 Tax=Clostridium sp. SHJSY1 TaxID=2942483 RepID=UPI002875FA4D|nr:TspO/MBR family protein [Clostridium sp. SHJSY1]MDS0527153.1 tryptophan-rich sensory protein [Clostridium sp. SHJSY1]
MVNIFKVNGKFKLIPLIVLTLLPLVGAYLVNLVTRNGVAIYGQLEKPFFAPPPILFMIIWPVLYILMGFASYRIYMIRESGKDIGTALFYYLIQLLLNYFWSFIFFSFRLYGLAFIELIILLVFIIITFIKFIKLDKIAGILLIPYIIWVSFAGVLNYFIWAKNEM